MSFKDLKNSNTLVALYVDELNINSTNEILYSISEQTLAVDLLLLYPKNFSQEIINILQSKVKTPKIVLRKSLPDNSFEENEIVSEKNINFVMLPTSSDTFPKIFNEAFGIALENKYEFFSIVEPNDVLSLTWYETANIYAEENKGVSMFFPLIRNNINGVFNGILNEATWVETLSEEAGKLDISLLQRFNCIVPTGAIFKVSSIEQYSERKEGKVCPIKESFKISHYYEFLMRMVYNDVKGMSVPRIGYEFKIKTNNFFNHSSCKIPQNIVQIPEENGGISPLEGKFWMDLAKKEYFFDEDRNKIYEPTEQ